MAKKFAGFKPETLQNKILPALGYNGPTDQASINKFLASSPSAAAKMGKFTMVARQMVEGKPIKAAPGTSVEETDETEGTTGNVGNVVSSADITENILLDPKAAVSTPTVVSQIGDGTIVDSSEDKFNVATDGQDLKATQAVAADDIVAPDQVTTQQVTAAQSQDQVQEQADKFAGATGTVSDQATYDATTVDPTTSAVLDLDVAQGEAAQVDAPDALRVGEGELIDGSTVNQSRIEEELSKEKAASVKDELDDLMQDFEGGNTPAWAAGAMRQANAVMAARGLSASSMAGMAVVQAAMESALPIAKLDAGNKQQMAVEKARQRAEFLGIEFDQEFETKVKNAARISEVANMNFTAEQDIALENARLTNTMNIANLDAKSAKTVADTAALASLERANLSAINTAAADNAQAFLDMDFKNLDNEQQAAMVKFQEMANAIIQDTNQKNVVAQTNMQEANDAEQFLLDLASKAAVANQNQSNIMAAENARNENLMAEFNAEDKRAREEFNAENARIIETANATFKQQVTTEETAAINAAYEIEAKAANTLSKAAYDALISEAKDLMYYAFEAENNHLDRVNKVTTATINSGSGNELEKGLADMAKEVVTSWITSRFKSSTSTS